MRSFVAVARLGRGDLERAVRLSAQATADAESQPDAPPGLDLYLHHYQIMAATGEPGATHTALQRACNGVQKRLATPENLPWGHASVEKMPLHRQIVATWEALQPPAGGAHRAPAARR
jgi:hypothetical protein